MANNKQKLSVENVKITSRISPASKTFKALYIIPLSIATTVGTIGLIGSSVVSALGYFGYETIIKNLDNVVTNFGTKFTEFTTDMTTSLDKFLKGKKYTKIDRSNIKEIVNFVSNKFFLKFGVPMSQNTELLIINYLNTEQSNGTLVEGFSTKFVTDFLTPSKAQIESNISTTVEVIKFNLFGKRDPENKQYAYTSLKTWEIVFAVTTAVAGIMVLSILEYWISRIVDRSRSKKDVKALKRIAKAADEKDVELVIGKITNRYSFDN